MQNFVWEQTAVSLLTSIHWPNQNLYERASLWCHSMMQQSFEMILANGIFVMNLL